MKIIITENQYKKLLEQQLDLFADEEEELPMSDESDEEEEEVIPIITYSTTKHKPTFGLVFFSDVKGDLPSEGKIKLVNVRKPKSKGEREDDIIIDVNKFIKSEFGYKVNDTEPEVRNVKSFDDTIEKETSTIGPDIINTKYKQIVFDSLKEIYGRNPKTWLNDGKRGPEGRGGVINIYTINDYLLAKNLITTSGEGGEWSILNYFDTNPSVREKIMKMYSKPINSKEDLNEWCDWIYENRVKLFTKGPELEKFVKLNFGSFHNGFLNEDKAYKYVSDLISSDDNLSISNINLPGSSLDRSGIDFTVKNKIKRSKSNFQAKPFGELSNNGSVYTITSYNVRNVEKKPVQYLIFASKDKDEVVIFENKTGQIKSTFNSVEFDYPPISPEELLKEL
jgi:hypothetical protein